MSGTGRNRQLRYQQELEEKRRKYIENRTIRKMNKKAAALAAGFSFSMATRPATRIETPEVLAAIASFEASRSDRPVEEVDLKALTEEQRAERKRWLEEQLGIRRPTA